MKFGDPVRGVPGEVFAYRRSVRAIEVQRVAPLVLVPICEVGLGVLPLHGSGRSEMVVDDVQDDAEPEMVSAVNEGAEVVWRPVQMVRRIRKYAVVSPAESSRELRHRHHFYGCDANSLQPLEMFCRGAPG